MTTESVAVSEMTETPDWPEVPDEPVGELLDPYQVNGKIHHYTGSSHTEEGHITKDPSIIADLNERLREKIESRVDELSLVKSDLDDGADTLILSYGISARSMEAAVNQLRAKGEKVSALTVYSLWPIPEKKILEYLKDIKRIIIPEMNHGQYRHEIERLTNDTIELVGVNRVDTFLITPEEIVEAYHG